MAAQLYTIQKFDGYALSKKEQQERKQHFFEWLEQPENHKEPRTITECEKYLNVSHVTIIKWHKEWKNLVQLGQRTRVKVSPEEVTKLLTKRLQIVKPLLEKGSDPEDPVDYMRQTVELGLWYGTAQVVDKLDSMLGMVILPDQAVELIGSLVSTLDKMEQMAIRRAGKVKAEVKEEQVMSQFGSLVSGMNLPSSGRPGEPPIEIEGKEVPALPAETEPLEAEVAPGSELAEADEPPTEEDDDTPLGASMAGLEV